MDSTSLIGPAVVAAGVSGVIAGIGLLVTRSTTIGIHREKIEADQDLARQTAAIEPVIEEAAFDPESFKRSVLLLAEARGRS
ncbi:UNVERIFIED_ORG: hypothetical protein GGD58_000540 [Rhizobium pisi]